ncbi:uncharacterized protein LOC128712558 [Anopheles marshallii]|uniref:uncharacterized protein LOC128712558 n=1 Tax=Anopheles marshallii TaxID=1521116 RepID=UPI00237A3BDC|nr:uncharacterized protein LOC128712558 [Anopheles marshallii]
MDDEMDLSLDDIIRKRKTKRPRYTDGPAQRGTNANGLRGGYRVDNGANRRHQRPVEDARMKIIKNKRAKMRDARDQLNEINRGRNSRYRWYKNPRQPDVSSGVTPAISTNGRNNAIPDHLKRMRLDRSYADPEYVPTMPTPSGPLPRYFPTRGISFGNGTPDEGEFERMNVQRLTVNQPMGSLANATRTLHNDAYTLPSSMPPFPHFRTVRATSTPMNSNNGTQLAKFTPPSVSSVADPFDQYEVNHRPNLNVPPPPLPAGNRPPLRGILRTKPSTPPAPTISIAPVTGVPQNLSPSMRARLERAPNPNKSMGIFAHNFGGEPPLPSPPTTSVTGYRIVVSNLHPSVSQIDIKELFEDIGDLLESRLVRPGVAEVIYRNLKDAEKAVDAYHNRQLDGQPMNCLLVNPRAATNLKYGR